MSLCTFAIAKVQTKYQRVSQVTTTIQKIFVNRLLLNLEYLVSLAVKLALSKT